MTKPTRDEVGLVLDGGDREEALAGSISLSLRNMDVNIEGICEIYCEELVNIISSGANEGLLFGGHQESNLHAHIHAFFLHLGAARDYLGAFIAHRLGLPEGVDDFPHLLRNIRPEHISSNQLLRYLQTNQCIAVNASNKVERSGWLQEVSEARRQLVHKRPYGLRFSEQFGSIKKMSEEYSIYKYVRNIAIGDGEDKDMLDFIQQNYLIMTKVFFDLASLSGMNTSIPIIAAKDIISFTRFEG